jgi:DNA-binding phage protein
VKKEQWLQELDDEYKNDPEFIAAGILVDINAQFLKQMNKLGIKTKKELADKMGVSESWLTKQLTLGASMKIDTIVAIASALGLEVKKIKLTPWKER